MLHIINRIQENMNNERGKYDFLIKCKQLQHDGKIQQLVIPDKLICSSTLLSYQQKVASQYACAMQDNTINPNNFKNNSNYSMPVYFAMLRKSTNAGNHQQADRILTTLLRQPITNSKNKHMLLYNKVKNLYLMNNLRKATFYCQTLLKQSGDGNDYYTCQFLLSLVTLGRVQQALKIAARHIQGTDSQQKHKIQTIYILILQDLYQKNETKLYKKIQQSFHNKKVCLRNWFNIALLLKKKHPKQSLQLFLKILTYPSQKMTLKFQILTKINILQLYQQKINSQFFNDLPVMEIKHILQNCKNTYIFLQKHVQFNNEIEQKIAAINQNLKSINNKIQNINNKQFLQSINMKKKQQSIIAQQQYIMTEAQINENYKKQNEQFVNFKYFNEKRLENQKRLKFLLKKQKELKNFFDKLKIQKKGSKLNIKVLDKSVLQKSLFDKSSSLNKELSLSQIHPVEEQKLYQAKYEEKKKKYEYIYENNQINSIINQFVKNWVSPTRKQNIFVKNAQNMRQFVINLDQPQQTQKQKHVYQKSASMTTRSNLKVKSNRTSQTFRVKNNNNISCKTSQKMLQGLKYNDFISNKIMHNLKHNIADKKKQEYKQNFFKKSFKQCIHEGQILQSQNKLQQAHQHYTQMYKNFKEDKQKQVLLIKIAQVFQKLSFIDQALKTYIKCTRFNSIQAFFKLGSLQIRNGQIQAGIQNLQKANCIDRYNLKIQIQLVYAYSLLQQTTERALSLSNAILKKNPQCMQALVMTSKILQKKGKLKEALDIALAIANNVSTAAVFHYIGLLYLSDSNVSQAFKFFQKAVQFEPNHHPSLIELATIVSQQKPQQAIEILKNVLSMSPNNELAFARLGKIYETYENDYENALIIYKKGLQYSASYDNYLKIGDCQFKLGNVVDAFLSYKQALSIKRTPQVFQKIAQVHQFQHQEKKAIQIYATALAQLPKQNVNYYQKHKKYLYKLGKLSLSNQQYESAYGYLSQVVEMEDSFQILKLLGQASFGKGDYNQALKYYELAAAKQPQDNLELLENIAMCLDKLEQYLSSKQIYQKILSIDPKNIKCLNNLANILLILGKTNQAFYWYQFMLQQAPNSLEKRVRVVDIYATIGDWSKVQQHLLICYKQKQNDIRIIQRMVNLYKQKRDTKQLNKFQKRLALLKSNAGKPSN